MFIELIIQSIISVSTNNKSLLYHRRRAATAPSYPFGVQNSTRHQYLSVVIPTQILHKLLWEIPFYSHKWLPPLSNITRTNNLHIPHHFFASLHELSDLRSEIISQRSPLKWLVVPDFLKLFPHEDLSCRAWNSGFLRRSVFCLNWLHSFWNKRKSVAFLPFAPHSALSASSREIAGDRTWTCMNYWQWTSRLTTGTSIPRYYLDYLAHHSQASPWKVNIHVVYLQIILKFSLCHLQDR